MNIKQWRRLLDDGSQLLCEVEYTMAIRNLDKSNVDVFFDIGEASIDLVYKTVIRSNADKIVMKYGDKNKDFYWGWLRKNFSEDILERKLKRAVKLPSFEPSIVVFDSEKFNINTVDWLGKIAPTKGIPMKIVVTLDAKNESAAVNYPKERYERHIKDFASVIEKFLLEDLEYLKFAKK